MGELIKFPEKLTPERKAQVLDELVTIALEMSVLEARKSKLERILERGE